MSGPPYRALAVANEFINRAKESGRGVDPLQLQKLLYFAHGWHLAVTGKPLLDERVEAWKYGPVVPSIYRVFKSYGSRDISDLGERYKRSEDRFVRPRVPKVDTETHELIDAVWSEYGSLSGLRLSDLSHKEGTPWDTTVKEAQKSPYGFRFNQDIDDRVIHKYFLSLIKAKE